MKKVSKFRCLFGLLLSMLILVWFWWAQNVNTLSITPSTYTWRYFCPIQLSVVANYWWAVFSNCQYSLSFDSSLVQLWYVSRGSAYLTTDTVQLWHNILSVEERNNNPISETVVCSNLLLTWIGGGSATIDFVTISWTLPTSNDFLHTEDLLNLSYNWSDTLTWVQNLYVEFYACPCVSDSKAPVVWNWSHDVAWNIHYTWVQTIRFLVYDKDNNHPWQYWTNGTHNVSNYTWWAPAWMDNQEWVKSDSLQVEIYSGGVLMDTLTPGAWLTVDRYTGTLADTPEYTWDGYDRWYWVSFDTTSLSVETPITFVLTASDNTSWIKWWCTTDKHVMIFTGILNKEKAPTIIFNSPIWQNINPNTWVILTVADDWAWIDTGSLVVEILPVVSWGQIIMTWSIYSWSDLHFDLQDGSEELWWASEYVVSFQPKYEFAVDSNIILSWNVKDLVGVVGTWRHTFHTRKDCTFYGCVNFVDIFSGSMNISNLIQWHFTWSLIVVTGTSAPYPYLTWSSWEIVMCWPIGESINLDWNIDIYSEWQIINWQLYQDEDLYVTGLDFTYESGVITPIY